MKDGVEESQSVKAELVLTAQSGPGPGLALAKAAKIANVVVVEVRIVENKVLFSVREMVRIRRNGERRHRSTG